MNDLLRSKNAPWAILAIGLLMAAWGATSPSRHGEGGQQSSAAPAAPQQTQQAPAGGEGT